MRRAAPLCALVAALTLTATTLVAALALVTAAPALAAAVPPTAPAAPTAAIAAHAPAPPITHAPAAHAAPAAATAPTAHAALAAAIAPAATAAATAHAPSRTPAPIHRASLVDVENEVMCTTCNVPLNVASSPQADRERALIRGLIAQGLDKRQIKAALVSQYGEDVLALPSSGGFGLTAYAIPFGLVALLAAGLALLLPSWRRRSAAGIGVEPLATLSEGDARRLDDDLRRYD